MYVDAGDVERVEMLPGFWRQTLVHGDELMLVLFSMRRGAELTGHSHVHEQLGYVIDGSVELTIAGVRESTPSGCCYLVDSNRWHFADVLTDSLVIDAFSPPREDYLPGAPQAFGATAAQAGMNGGISAIRHAREAAVEEPAPGVARRRLLRGHRVAMSLLALRPGAVLAADDAGHERAGYVVTGAVDVSVDGSRRRCAAGLSFLARPGEPLRLATGDGARVVLVDAGGALP